MNGEHVLSHTLQLLNDDRGSVRRAAAQAAGMHGKKAIRCAPDLVLLLQDKYQAVQLAAATSLGQIGPQAADVVPDIISLLSSDHPHTKDEIETKRPASVDDPDAMRDRQVLGRGAAIAAGMPRRLRPNDRRSGAAVTGADPAAHRSDLVINASVKQPTSKCRRRS